MKRWKLMQAVGMLACLTGVAGCAGGLGMMPAAWLVGLPLWFAGRTGEWWA